MQSSKWLEVVQNGDLISEGERVEAGINLLCDELWLKPDDLVGYGTVTELKDRVLAKLRDKHDDTGCRSFS
jgi:hypothetical protein